MADGIVLTEATYYILLALCKQPHGYGIMQTVEALSGGRVRLRAGTLYGALTNLTEKGWIRLMPVEDGSRKKEYLITQTGVTVLKSEINRLKELAANGEKILEECSK